jgi:hypothetical protein
VVDSFWTQVYSHSENKLQNLMLKIPNPTHQITNKSQILISKFKTNLFLNAFFKGSCEAKTCVLDIGILIFDIIWNLVLGACDLQIFFGMTIIGNTSGKNY